MWTLRQPSTDRIRAFLEEQGGEELSYPEPGLTLRMPEAGPPAGYDFDHERTCVGRGAEAWEGARAAVRRWTMFPSPLTRVAYPFGPGPELAEPPPPLAEGTTVGMLVRAFGVWWVNACRIIYTVDEPRRFGFAYGTLPGHVERGEERFLVERGEEDAIWYDLLAFSRPRAWIVRLGYPLARALQARFRIQSLEAMRRAVGTEEDW